MIFSTVNVDEVKSAITTFLDGPAGKSVHVGKAPCRTLGEQY